MSKCDHRILSLRDLNINEIDESTNIYLIEHDKKYDFNEVKNIFKLIFHSNNFSKYITLKFKNHRTRFWFKQFLENVLGDFRNV